MLSTDRRLKLLTDTFASQKISAFMLSPSVINPRDCDEQAELSADCFEKATSFFCFLSTLCLIASMCSFAYYAVTTEFSLHCHTSPAHHRTDNMLGIHCPFLHHSPILCPLLSTEESQVSENFVCLCGIVNIYTIVHQVLILQTLDYCKHLHLKVRKIVCNNHIID